MLNHLYTYIYMCDVTHVFSKIIAIANLLFAKHINGRPRETNLSAFAVAILLIIFTSFLIDRCLSLRFTLKKDQHTRDIRLFLFIRYNSHDSVMGMADDKFSRLYVTSVVMAFPRMSAIARR